MKKRYSTYIPFILLIIDLLLINTTIIVLKDLEYLNYSFLLFINLSWIASSYITGLIKFQRRFNYFKTLSILASQFLIFVLAFFAFFTLFREGEIVNNQTKIIAFIICLITLSRLAFIYLLKKYRYYGKNSRKVIVLGYNKSAKDLSQILINNKELGYNFLGFFSDKKNTNEKFIGKIDNYKEYVLQNDVDEIYCSLSEFNNKKIKQIKQFANKHNKVVKLIPNSTEIYNKNITKEFFGDSLLVLKVKKLPFELIENKIIKRLFDLIFSSLVCLFVISWLYPILWLIIKIDSRGPVIFKQGREGINGDEFLCYKFRSMTINNDANKKSATKNDVRITKVGAFLRKTSLDEIPQFFNVFFGEMSVVGPRPHMNAHSRQFDNEVSNYMERKSVKPGITGLAQVSGYRGEIKCKSDIVNRVRFDVFYIENWSLSLDIKIIFKTIFNVFKGEEKAY